MTGQKENGITPNEFLNLMYVQDELKEAKAKHPTFVTDGFSTLNVESWRQELDLCRETNSACETAESILNEEIAEAFVAYLEGNKKRCLKELAQCGAVILRMMDFVDNEIMAETDKTVEAIHDTLHDVFGD